MIRLSDDALAEFFSRYVTGALELYLQAKRGVQSLAAYNPLAQIPVAASDALARMWMANPFGGYQTPTYGQGYAPSPETAAPPPPAENGEAPKRNDEVAAMRRELDELKQAIRDGLGPKRKKRKP